MDVRVELLAVDGRVNSELEAVDTLCQVIAVDVLSSGRGCLDYLILVLDKRKLLTV